MKNWLLFLLITLFLSCNSTEAQRDTATSVNKKETFKIVKSDKEWKEILTKEQYYVLRQEGTEPPFSSPLNNVKEAGIFYCAACNTPLYETKHKFDSGTGWPSFDQGIKGNIGYDTDRKLGYIRTELVCGTCGGHLGHMFEDGPSHTTGKRHCINGDALLFKPTTK
ncbi:peptide-methionine (R)-S-oxide reductase MsrB [Aquimarina sp. W85]|uniref:peptide-methionine (R)-S-oxide reductase MsrB n=1 Tax=Aquimarina rhodophyticola TaxID=3342246 RepID=UPI003672F355